MAGSCSVPFVSTPRNSTQGNILYICLSENQASQNLPILMLSNIDDRSEATIYNEVSARNVRGRIGR